jgi:hypothetical protein
MPCDNNYGIIKWSGMMDWVIAVRAAALGGTLGRIGWEAFERRSTTFTAKAASAIVSVMVGPAVAGIFQAIAGTKSALPREVWFYPVGLLFGAVVCSNGSVRQARRSGNNDDERCRSALERRNS